MYTEQIRFTPTLNLSETPRLYGRPIPCRPDRGSLVWASNSLHASHPRHLEVDGTDLREYHRVAELQFIASTEGCPTLRERACRLLAERMRSGLHGTCQQRAV